MLIHLVRQVLLAISTEKRPEESNNQVEWTGLHHRRPWIQRAGVDSGRTLRFSFGARAKNLWKTEPAPGVTFQFS